MHGTHVHQLDPHDHDHDHDHDHSADTDVSLLERISVRWANKRISLCSPSLEGFSVHPLWLSTIEVKDAGLPADLFTYSVDSPCGPIIPGFALAGIGQLTTASTGEGLTWRLCSTYTPERPSVRRYQTLRTVS